MSYDIAIVKDIGQLEITALDKVRTVLLQQQHVQEHVENEARERYFVYDDGNFAFSVDCDLMGEVMGEEATLLYDFEAGHLIEPTDERVRNKVNLIRLSCGFDESKTWEMWRIASAIASQLGWRVYDYQNGDYVPEIF